LKKEKGKMRNSQQVPHSDSRSCDFSNKTIVDICSLFAGAHCSRERWIEIDAESEAAPRPARLYYYYCPSAWAGWMLDQC
jgi:hypothetical protein